MANAPSSDPRTPPLEQALADARNAAREQLHAASQFQLDRLAEEFKAGWKSQVEKIFHQRLAELAWRIEAQLRGQHEQDRIRLVGSTRRDLTSRLSQIARRLRTFENEQQWSQSFVRSTDGFCGRAALFVVNQGFLELRAARGFENAPAITEKIALASAPAFASAVDTKDAVVAMRTPRELSEAVATMVGGTPAQRCHLFPLGTRERVPAILYADSEDGSLEASALDLLSTIGGSVLEALSAGQPQPAGLLRIPLTKPDDDLHLKAQRFARVKVAEMRLYKSQAVKEGRANRDLYSHLKTEIDSAREAFGHDFLESSPSMADYFHLELVRTLANDDVSLLGPEYPGPLA